LSQEQVLFLPRNNLFNSIFRCFRFDVGRESGYRLTNRGLLGQQSRQGGEIDFP
jgi:hypothetical protein